MHASAKTSHFENYRYKYRFKIVGFGESVLGDIRNIPTQKMRLRNQHQKLRGIWLGRDLITNEHILALPFSTATSGAYRRRQITCLPREEQHDIDFLKNSTGHNSVTTSTSKPRSTLTTFRSRTSPLVIYNCKNHRVRMTSSNLRVFDLQSLTLKQLPVVPPQEQPPIRPAPGLLNHLKQYSCEGWDDLQKAIGLGPPVLQKIQKRHSNTRIFLPEGQQNSPGSVSVSEKHTP